MGCKVIAIANQKGGVGKTISTYNLAAAKALDNPQAAILMIDLDPQASLTIATGFEPGDKRFKGYSTISLFDNKVTPTDACFLVEATKLENLYIVPSDIGLAVTETHLVTRKNPAVQLANAVDKLRQYFDYIYIDCPPQLGTLLTNALTAADGVLIPCKTEYLSLRGLGALMESIKAIQAGDGRRSLNPSLQFLGVVATMYQMVSKDAQDVLNLLREQYPVKGIIKQTVEVNRKLIDGLPIVMSNQKSDAATAYKEIAKDL